MKFSILVLGAPYSSQCAYSAYKFTEALLNSRHQIGRVFFYKDAVHTGTGLATPPTDEFNLYHAWQELKTTHDVELMVCIAAAARRGILDSSEAARHEKEHSNLHPCFELAGLGQLIESAVNSDQLITFGA